jgi:hypothetical protein
MPVQFLSSVIPVSNSRGANQLGVIPDECVDNPRQRICGWWSPNPADPDPTTTTIDKKTTPVTTQPADDLIFGFEPQTLMIMGAIGIGLYFFMSSK